MLSKFIILFILTFCLIKFSKSHNLIESPVFVEQEYLYEYENINKNITNGLTNDVTNGSNRSPRIYFPIWEMIEFQNDACLTVDGLFGTCYSRTECDLFRGITRGFCARGFGVCCFFTVSCGGNAIHNRTHFLNPMFPMSFNQEFRCQMSITLPQDACQLRINFVRFLIHNPRRSECAIDSLLIPHPYNLPVLCGNLTGQHIYLEATQVRELLIIITTTGTERPRYWLMEFVFIECTLTLMAPSGCLQYYWGVTGEVRTMNYDCPRYIRNNDEECLMANLEYTICVRIENQRCAIQWTAIEFQMGPSGIQGSQRGDFCQENYITINNAKMVTSDRQRQNLRSFDRFCGSAFNFERNNVTNIPIITRMKPFTLGVTTRSPSFEGIFRGAAFTWEQRVCIDAIVN